MNILIAEDDITSRMLLHRFLEQYGPTRMVGNGREAVEAVQASLETGERYDLICLDIMMPEMDGQEALRKIRALEDAKGIAPANCSKVIMTSALNDPRNVMTAFKCTCDGYIVKPIEKAKLLETMKNLGLL